VEPKVFDEIYEIRDLMNSRKRIDHASNRMAFVCEKFDEAIVTYQVSYPDYD